MKRKYRYGILYILIICILTNCQGNMQPILEAGGENRAELEKVLNHFSNDPDPLKFRAAKFLVENMGFHYYFDGEGMDLYDSAFMECSHEIPAVRDSVFRRLLLNDGNQDVFMTSDLESINAEYLIKEINEACNVWSKSNWHNEYDEEIFFDYVLPYRVLSEHPSNWRDGVKKKCSVIHKPALTLS